MGPRIASDFLDLLIELNRAEARYLLVGGHAVAFHGRPRADVDALERQERRKRRS
jgi:hypothetical protein